MLVISADMDEGEGVLKEMRTGNMWAKERGKRRCRQRSMDKGTWTREMKWKMWGRQRNAMKGDVGEENVDEHR